MRLLDDGVTPLADVERARQVHLGADVIVLHGGLSQRAQRVEPRHGVRRRLHARDLVGDELAHLVEELVFQLRDALARRQERVLELLELVREIPLARHQRLLADIVLRQLGDARTVGNVDIIAENLVVADLELLCARALALALLEFGDGLRAVIAHVAQAVDLLAVAGAEDAALAHGKRRLVTDRAVDARAEIGERVHLRNVAQRRTVHVLQQRRQLRQLRAAERQRVQIPPVGRAVHRARDKALHIADLPQAADQLAAQHALAHQLLHRAEAAADLHGAQQRTLDPCAQQAAAHGRFRLVEHPEEAAALFAGAEVFRQLQIAARGVVELHVVVVAQQLQPPDVAEVALLRLVQVGQQRAGRAHGRRRIAEAELICALHVKLLAHARSRRHVFKPVAARLDQTAEALGEEGADVVVFRRRVGAYGLARGKAPELVEDVAHGVGRVARGAELPRREVAERRAAGLRAQIHRAEIVRLVLLEHRGLRDRAGRDDADDVPLDQPLGKRGILHLLADGHLVALGDQAADVRLGRVVRHAAHGRALGGVFDVAVARREREVELARGKARIVVEHLIKIAQPEKQQAVGIALLDLVILPLHRRQFRHVTPPRRRAPTCCCR